MDRFHSMIIIEVTVNRFLRMVGLSGDIGGVFFVENYFADNNRLMRRPGANVM
jgi:hypothetical protein